MAKIFALIRETLSQPNGEIHTKGTNALKKLIFEEEQPNKRLFLFFKPFGTKIAHNKGIVKTTCKQG